MTTEATSTPEAEAVSRGVQLLLNLILELRFLASTSRGCSCHTCPSQQRLLSIRNLSDLWHIEAAYAFAPDSHATMRRHLDEGCWGPVDRETLERSVELLKRSFG